MENFGQGIISGEGKLLGDDEQRAETCLSNPQIYQGQANGNNPVNGGGLSRKHIIEGVNASLERLGLEYVDLIYAHRPDRYTSMEDIVRAFNHIVDTRKAFYWGTLE